MMDTKMETLRTRTIERLERFIRELKITTDPLDAEAQLYVLVHTAEMAFNDFHRHNNMAIKP